MVGNVTKNDTDEHKISCLIYSPDPRWENKITVLSPLMNESIIALVTKQSQQGFSASYIRQIVTLLFDRHRISNQVQGALRKDEALAAHSIVFGGVCGSSFGDFLFLLTLKKS